MNGLALDYIRGKGLEHCLQGKEIVLRDCPFCAVIPNFPPSTGAMRGWAKGDKKNAFWEEGPSLPADMERLTHGENRNLYWFI